MDGMLHPSGDLLGSLRHSQLRLAGAPTLESQIVSDIRLMSGTLWHRFITETLIRAGVHVEQEIDVTPGLPEGWSGTADGLFWDSESRGFLLRDYKTIKGEGMRWVLKDGAKDEHIWQLSAYWHGLFDMGYPLLDEFEVFYLPQNDTTDREENIEPAIMSCKPLDRELVFGLMQDKWSACRRYLEVGGTMFRMNYELELADYLNEALAPEQPRVQKIYWNGKQSVFDVKLVPHWSAQFCSYPTDLCGCSEQGSNKIGHYTLEEKYEPRKGYEEELPMIEPSTSDYRKRQKESKKEEDASNESGSSEPAVQTA